MRCIDADALKELFPDNGEGLWTYNITAKAYIDAQPTIEPERKTGQWLPDNNNYYEERYICSACKRSYKVDTCMGKPIWNYCPCGAKMEEGEQDG